MPSAPGSGFRRRAASPPTAAPPVAAAEDAREHPRCPRCDSPDTKFCYYNNYNLTQPRHFCKSCRRYWTLGGTLRNVPVGGACRKATSPSPSSSAASKRRRRCRSLLLHAAPAPSSPPAVDELAPIQPPAVVQDDPIADAAAADVAGTFGALLAEPLPAGLLALGGPFSQGRACLELELGLSVSGIEEMGFGLGRTGWPFLGDEVEGTGDGTSCDDAWRESKVGGSAGAGDGVVRGGGGGGGCFAWSDLAISTLGKGKGEA